MSNKNITIKDATKIITPERERDSTIMEHIYKHPGLTSNEKETFNKCRIYLKVFLMSELCTGNGQYILENIWDGQRDDTKQDKYNWPLEEKPKKED